MTCTIPAGRGLLLSTALTTGHRTLLAAGAMVMVTMLNTTSAYADECPLDPPPVPAPTADLSGNLSGPGPSIGTLYRVPGCSGKASSSDGSGHIGGAGQARGDITLVMPGGSIDSPSGPAIVLTAVGGDGGDGSIDADFGVNTTAGSGGVGGDGGDISFSVAGGSTFSAGSMVISLQTTGGQGGRGQTGYFNGSGGAGGNGGDFTLFMLSAGSSVITIGSDPAVLVGSQGGAGGDQRGSTRTFVNDGKSAGRGGYAGNIAANFDGSIQATQSGGISIQGTGGNGGTGDDVISVSGEATGTTGGDGGSGSSTIQFEMSGSVVSGQTGLSIVANGGNACAGAYAGAGANGHGGLLGDDRALHRPAAERQLHHAHPLAGHVRSFRGRGGSHGQRQPRVRHQLHARVRQGLFAATRRRAPDLAVLSGWRRI